MLDIFGDVRLWEIVALSLQVSLAAVLLATALGLPLGAAVAVGRFPGRHAVIVLLNALMGLPPVVVGLLVYLLLSRAGPLGELGLLFPPGAMVIAQTILILPIIAALCRQAVEDAWVEYQEQLRSLGVEGSRAAFTVLWDIRFSLLTAILAGLGRARAGGGAVMIVGGNIDGVTRGMTTAIALETSKGDLPLALGLGHLAHRPARVLSGGEQQRLALARAWALHPEVLFLDEPTASLDPTATREIEAVIRAFDGAGTKIVMATHNLGQARRLGDEVIYLHQGRMVERAPVEKFFAQPATPEAAAFIKGELPWD